ncbi:hypothetical protein Pmar_PMAR017089 [Perkinsus marinus ATCC 50983]|uniref:Uncharacterized protein n=1 Tax=Perkinsus marinus (strain ATCC 50983 / TXsc) TaxID=423536 RepID=C5LSJ0_PERM5|nr:hypothetical protein Pmar_PMAR017089 [Perkinsus marinus ATCC 50983]EER00231.1 hypothetical protein Pmar_PMAR017089 [Perkinsus marinus ATCC 50983]|eukprot:XP_002767513.1 hypothetical protein Pmar_PMAR017089 [Perkinsus marinus ATCC 50983]
MPEITPTNSTASKDMKGDNQQKPRMPNTYPPTQSSTKTRQGEQTSKDYRVEALPMNSREARYSEAQMRSRAIPRMPQMMGIPESPSPSRPKKSPFRDDSELIESCRGTPLHDMYLQAEQLLSGLEDTPDKQSMTMKKALTELVEVGASELVRRAKFDEETTRQRESVEKRKVREARRRVREEFLMGWSVIHEDSSVLYTSTSRAPKGHRQAHVRRSTRHQRAREAA